MQQREAAIPKTFIFTTPPEKQISEWFNSTESVRDRPNKDTTTLPSLVWFSLFYAIP